ncbi:MAG: hypothetical protein R2729_08405 [Bryobacteraceae bacterium]
MPAITFAQTKSCCYIAYDGRRGQVWNFPDGTVWEVVDHWSTMLTGFKAVAMRQTGAGRTLVLAFAGTDSLRDVVSDAAQVLGFVPFQYHQALRLARSLNPNHYTGHSLGGGMADYCAVLTGVEATTINPAPLVAASTISAWLLPNRHIVNYIAGGSEFVSSSIGVNPGQNVPVEANGNFFTRHSLANVGPRIALPTLRGTGAPS